MTLPLAVLRNVVLKHKLGNINRFLVCCHAKNVENDRIYVPVPAQADSIVTDTDSDRKRSFNERVNNGPTLQHFIANQAVYTNINIAKETDDDTIPYLSESADEGNNRKVYFETYGCQMNVSDTEVAWSILKGKGFRKAEDITESDVILVMTCSIREGAEEKIWKRLKYLKHLKKIRFHRKDKPPLKIGILGCMAERLKKDIIEREQMVDLVCGPDAYRDLPRMLAVTESGHAAVNVQLSLEETYADIIPVRINSGSKSAFVSIQRGCDNMCSYCIVPFTRGRERSRPMSSILEEVKLLSDQGIKEVTLLGQNVNSYRDLSEVSVPVSSTPHLSKGFSTVYKAKQGGRRFTDLLSAVSQIDPEMRIRFTSPHPKDFPDEVLYLIRERDNICRQLHMPAQSGSSRVLELMRRGYTREAYIDLVSHVRDIIPDVSLSSDFIAGFCGETEEDHQLTLDLMHHVQYNFAFCFPYSLRTKTRAFHRLQDNVLHEVKSRRHLELTDAFRKEALKLNQAQIGQIQLILVENTSKRSDAELYGRNDGNTKVIFPRNDLPVSPQEAVASPVLPGDYIIVQITDASSQVLKGTPICHSSIRNYNHHKQFLTRQYICTQAKEQANV